MNDNTDKKDEKTVDNEQVITPNTPRITTDSTDDDIDAAIARVNDVLNKDNDAEMPAGIPAHAKETISKNIEEDEQKTVTAIKEKKVAPVWVLPSSIILMLLGLAWVLVFNLAGPYPIPALGSMNIGVGAFMLLAGLFVLTRWV